MSEDYELPEVDKIAEKILRGLVRKDQIGRELVPAVDRYFDLEENGFDLKEEEFDFILLKRRQGYLTEDYTDISGLEVLVFAKTTSRAMWLSNQVTKRLLDAETQTFDGWLIDFVAVLAGPEEDSSLELPERVVEKSFELHIRVKWK